MASRESYRDIVDRVGMTGKQIARLKKLLKHGPKMTRKECVEYLKWAKSQLFNFRKPSYSK
jgi:uncharacterized protein YerC